MRCKENVAVETMTMEEAGLVIRNGKLVPSGSNNDGVRRFIEVLRKAANDSGRAAHHSKPYKASLLMANARAARRDANRIERLLRE